jgi:hypothetical protein
VVIQRAMQIHATVSELLINRSTERITKAANAICLKDYSSFLKSKEAPA